MVSGALGALALIGAVVILGGLVRFVRGLYAVKRETREVFRWGS